MLGADAAASSVVLSVDNICRHDCQQLERLVSQWAVWRKQQPEYSNPSDAQLVRGSLQLDVSRLLRDGVLAWEDSIAPVAATGAVAGAAGAAGGAPSDAEQPFGPAYDRGTGELLAPAAADSTTLLPGGAAAARRRQLAQAASGEWLDGGLLLEAGAAERDTPGPKRQRVGTRKCHNCGSYSHSLGSCPVPFDQKRVSAAMAELRAERGPADPMLQMHLRYFHLPSLLPSAAAAGQQGSNANGRAAADVPQPGKISAELATALGMASAAAPPPWLCRMAVLGVPPRYAQENAAAAAGGGDDGDDGEEGVDAELMVFYRGGDDEADAASGPAAAADAGPPDPGEAAAGSQGGGSQRGDDDDDEDRDFIPFDGTAAAAAPAAAPPPPPPDHQQQQPQPPQEGKGQPPPPPQSPQPPRWCFPGVNVPADSEAWAQVLSQAAWLKGQLS